MPVAQQFQSTENIDAAQELDEAVSADAVEAAEEVVEANPERDLLMGVIFGALHEQDILSGAEFAAKIAVCAKMTNGDQEEYSRAVKRALVGNENLLDIFQGIETERCVQQFMRVIRNNRNDTETLEWLAGQFMEPQDPDVVKQYLIAVERALANTMIGRH
jgi:hypothetical protein